MEHKGGGLYNTRDAGKDTKETLVIYNDSADSWTPGGLNNNVS
jgi:hypothetical protein